MSRTYRSPVREEQARQTQARIVQAAYEHFTSGQGYPATTVAAIAASAGVSAQTVFNAFGSKAGLLKRVYDVTLVGDDEPVPLAQRPEIQQLSRLEDPREFLLGYAHLGKNLLLRVGNLVARIVEGAGAGDADLRALVDTTGRERRNGATGTVARVVALTDLRPGLSQADAIDVVWTLIGFEIWDLLVHQCGWTPDAYADFVGQAMGNALLGQPPP